MYAHVCGPMHHPIVPAALTTALALASELRGAQEALCHTGLDRDRIERFCGLPEDPSATDDLRSA